MNHHEVALGGHRRPEGRAGDPFSIALAADLARVVGPERSRPARPAVAAARRPQRADCASFVPLDPEDDDETTMRDNTRLR